MNTYIVKKYILCLLKSSIPLVITLYTSVQDYLDVIKRGDEFDFVKNYDLILFVLIGLVVSYYVYQKQIKDYNEYVILELLEINEWNEEQIIKNLDDNEFQLELFQDSLTNFKILERKFDRDFERNSSKDSIKDIHRMRMSFENEKWAKYNKQHILLSKYSHKYSTEAFADYYDRLKDYYVRMEKFK